MKIEKEDLSTSVEDLSRSVDGSRPSSSWYSRVTPLEYSLESSLMWKFFQSVGRKLKGIKSQLVSLLLERWFSLLSGVFVWKWRSQLLIFLLATIVWYLYNRSKRRSRQLEIECSTDLPSIVVDVELCTSKELSLVFSQGVDSREELLSKGVNDSVSFSEGIDASVFYYYLEQIIHLITLEVQKSPELVEGQALVLKCHVDIDWLLEMELLVWRTGSYLDYKESDLYRFSTKSGRVSELKVVLETPGVHFSSFSGGSYVITVPSKEPFKGGLN